MEEELPRPDALKSFIASAVKDGTPRYNVGFSPLCLKKESFLPLVCKVSVCFAKEGGAACEGFPISSP